MGMKNAIATMAATLSWSRFRNHPSMYSWDLSPFPATVANEAKELPTKNVQLLVVTITGQGDNPKYSL